MESITDYEGFGCRPVTNVATWRLGQRLRNERGTRTQIAAEKFNIRQIIDNAPLKEIHIPVLLIGLSLALVNGLDDQMLANTTPAMAADWRVQPPSFSAALTAGLLGMMIGAIVFGELADRIGHHGTHPENWWNGPGNRR